MSRKHRIGPGDGLGSLARVYGLSDPSTIWDHPDNAELRRHRGNPDLLMVGDEVTIPDAPEASTTSTLPTGHRHVFALRKPQDELRVRLTGLTPYVRAFGPIPFTLSAGPIRTQVMIDVNHEEIRIPLFPSVRRVELKLEDRTIRIDVGGLGPADEPRGVFHRLINLGYGDDVEAEATEFEAVTDPLSLAVASFRGWEGLPADGDLDEEVHALLRERFGGS